MSRKSKLRVIEELSQSLIAQTENATIVSKSLQAAGITNQALVESLAEMEQERDLYRMAFNIAAGRLAAYSKSEALAETLIEEILGQAVQENLNKRYS